MTGSLRRGSPTLASNKMVPMAARVPDRSRYPCSLGERAVGLDQPANEVGVPLLPEGSLLLPKSRLSMEATA